MKIRRLIKTYYEDERYTSIMDVMLFVFLILVFHFIFLLWQRMGYYPIGSLVASLQEWSSSLLYRQVDWVMTNIIGIDYVLDPPNNGFVALDKSGSVVLLGVAPVCASLKQWCHWLFLMLLFPGPWKHKVWYIPIGLIIIELTNVVRVCGIFLSMIYWPGSFEIAHNYIFKFFFYFIIFLMWVLWVEVFAHSRAK